MTEFEDCVYAWLLGQSRGGKTRLRTAALMPKLRAEFGQDSIALRKALHALRKARQIEFNGEAGMDPISAYLEVVAPIIAESTTDAAWREVLTTSSLTAADQAHLLPIGPALEGFSSDQMRQLIVGLHAIRVDSPKWAGQSLFTVSAKYLLGASKVLSGLDRRQLKRFGIPMDDMVERPPYVVLGGELTHPEAVILIENPTPFETAMQSTAARRCAFVCTFGHGLSAAANEFGNQLATIVEKRNAIPLLRNGGQQVELEALLQNPTIHFWGDLDIAGFQIYERISARFPRLQLSALYQPMLSALGACSTRHPYAQLVGKAGQQLYQSNRADVRQLLTRCVEFAVDQEIVGIAEIGELAGRELQSYSSGDK